MREQSGYRFRWGWLVMLLMIGAISGGAWWYHESWWPRVSKVFFKEPPPQKPRLPIPVVTASVGKRDMKVFLNGLGTVTSLNTATVRSEVEGELISIDFSEGQQVYKGRPLAEIDPKPYQAQLDQALGQFDRDTAALEIAKLNLKRIENLLPKMGATKQQKDEQEALVAQTNGIIKSDQALIDAAKLNLEKCTIKAKISGQIGLRKNSVGNIVRADDPLGLAVITQLEPIALEFTIPQDEIPRVQDSMMKGDQLVVQAYDRDFKKMLAQGTLMAIDNQVDPTTGTLRLKAEFLNQDHKLFPNQFVNTRLLVDVKRDAIVVPSSAVQRGPGSTFVYLVKSDESVELRDVQVGPSEGTETCIESGLTPGEVVVIEGIDKLQPGAKITTRDAKSEAGESESAQTAKAERPESTESPQATSPAPESQKVESAKESESRPEAVNQDGKSDDGAKGAR